MEGCTAVATPLVGVAVSHPDPFRIVTVTAQFSVPLLVICKDCCAGDAPAAAEKLSDPGLTDSEGGATVPSTTTANVCPAIVSVPRSDPVLGFASTA